MGMGELPPPNTLLNDHRRSHRRIPMLGGGIGSLVENNTRFIYLE